MAVLRLVLGAAGEVELGAPFEVAAAPPAGERRQIVRAGHRGGRVAPAAGLPEAEQVPLEPQHPHAEHAGLRHLVLEAGWDGAEVLADDDGAIAGGFEGDEA